jgi:hypothetical protein
MCYPECGSERLFIIISATPTGECLECGTGLVRAPRGALVAIANQEPALERRAS